MTKNKIYLCAGCILFGLLVALFWNQLTHLYVLRASQETDSPFIYTFSMKKSITEAGNSFSSSNPHWWVNSGAYLYVSSGIGQTVHGALLEDDPWKNLYAKNNPADTDLGYRPQNIFRLLTRSIWQNFRQEVYFRISADNLSDSENRNGSNGILLFNRYQDEDTLYYAGIRVDGTAVIKKKINGTYYTLLQNPLFADGIQYDRNSSPSVLPKNVWMGIRTDVSNEDDGSVTVQLSVDRGDGIWKMVADAKDDGTLYGAPIRDAGFAGIRTDFMDVQFDVYSIEEKSPLSVDQ